MGRRVLYVDDEPMMLRMVGRALRGRGWSVFCAQTPEQAVWDLDVVIADWNPYGPEIVRRAKEGGMPVVVFSGDPGDVPSDLRVVDKLAGISALEEALEKAISG